jgi:hypothetical protein
MKTKLIKRHEFSDNSMRLKLPEGPAFKLDYLVYPFFLGYEEIGRNYYNETQFNNFYMFNYTISGSATLTVNNVTYKLEQGDLILLHTYQKRILKPCGPWTIYCMHIRDNGNQLANLYAKFHKDNNYIIKNFPREIIEKHFFKIADGMKAKEPDLYGLAAETYGLIADVMKISDARNPFVLPNELRNSIGFLEDNFERQITLENIAEISGYSASHLEKLFRDHLGCSPLYYLHKLRLERSKQLLSATEFSLADIAAQTGFKNDRSLMYLFKKRFGMSPTEFRRKAKNALF